MVLNNRNNSVRVITKANRRLRFEVMPNRVSIVEEPRIDEANLGDNFDIPKTMSFVDACARLNSLDLDIHHERIEDTLAKFTVRIHGLPDCPDEDLLLAVYFFLEDSLDIKASIEMCTRYKKTNFVGVVFRNIKTKEEVLSRASIFQDTEIRILENKCVKWLVKNWPYDDTTDEMF